MSLTVVFVLCLAVSCCGLPLKDALIKDKNAKPRICLEPECVIASGIILSSLDTTVDPCQDFYRYSCGGWLDQAEIPPWSASVTKSFGELHKANLKIIKTILEEENTADSRSYESLLKARDYYMSCMDTEAMETAGAAPLLTLIDSFGGWGLLSPDTGENPTILPSDLLATLVAVHTTSGNPLFAMGIATDDKHSSRNIIEFSQAGLWLGSRELYLGGHEDLLTAYVDYGATVATLLAEDSGSDTAAVDFDELVRDRMNDVLDFEKQLAKITIPSSELRNSMKTYHKMTLGEFSDLLPEIDVNTYMQQMFGMEISPGAEVLVPTKDYFPGLNQLVQITSSRIIRDYMVWQAVASLAVYLPERYRQAELTFRYAYTGITAVAPRWTACANAADSVLGFVTGAEFVRKVNSIAIKDEVKAMIESVRQNFMDNLPSVDWMDDTTKSLAAKKAQAIVEKVVAPPWIQDTAQLDQHYDKLIVNPKSYFENRLATSTFYYERNLAKYQKPVDKTEWHMGPAEVNAYYTPTANQMVFPAGILQSPFYNPAMPMSVNYGSIGWVIGHELTHGFDDSGRMFDDEGNLHNWWKNESAEAYREHAQCIREQYANYTIGDMHINGLLTLGENIADNGGLRLALHAYEKYRDEQGHKESRLPGLQDMTPQQLFFIGAGQTWCMQVTPKTAMLKLLSDPHSPGKYRVTGTLSNMEEFSEAFQCAPGSVMNPVDKCRVW